MTSSDTTAKEPWQQITILDLLLLVPPFAIGAAAARAMYIDPQYSQNGIVHWPGSVELIGLLIIGLVLGGVFSAPVILLSQWIFRRRRKMLSAGECFWLYPITMWVFVYILSHILPAAFLLIIFALWIAGHLFCSGMAALFIIFWMSGERDSAPCLWTHVFGSIVCILATALLFYSYIAEPIRI